MLGMFGSTTTTASVTSDWLTDLAYNFLMTSHTDHSTAGSAYMLKFMQRSRIGFNSFHAVLRELIPSFEPF